MESSGVGMALYESTSSSKLWRSAYRLFLTRVVELSKEVTDAAAGRTW